MTRPLPCAQRPTKPKTAASIRVLKTRQRRRTKEPKHILMGVPSKAMAICDSEPSLNLLPPPSDHMGGGIQNPLLPCAGTKKRRVSKASFPPLLTKGEREFEPPPLPSLFSSSSLPLCLVPSLGHGYFLCPPWAVLGPAYTLPGPPSALLLAPPWASLGRHWALPGPP